MAINDPEPMIGVHLSNLEITRYAGPGARLLSAAERTYRECNAEFWQEEFGYKAIQSTKPQTLGYGLNDSPAGLAAWILEKWRAWADSRDNLDERFSREFLLTTVTLLLGHPADHILDLGLLRQRQPAIPSHAWTRGVRQRANWDRCLRQYVCR
jgi:hypothetical protein